LLKEGNWAIFCDKPTRGQSSCGLVSWWISQLAEILMENLEYIKL